MARSKVLVVSPTETLHAALARDLPPALYSIWDARPGPNVLRAVLSVRPDVAVVDRIDARPEAAQLEIALLKSFCPDARIIALSGHSSGTDATVVEQGLFYYMAAPSDGELVRVLESAAGIAPSGPGG